MYADAVQDLRLPIVIAKTQVRNDDLAAHPAQVRAAGVRLHRLVQQAEDGLAGRQSFLHVFVDAHQPL